MARSAKPRIREFESHPSLIKYKKEIMDYVRVDWPESQVIMDWKEEYQDQTILIDNAGYMVPKDLWEKHISNPGSLKEEYNEDDIDFPKGYM